MVYLLSTVFIVLNIYVNLVTCTVETVYAAVLFRHGDRTPVDPYPTDPWRNESLWPVKFGELTNTGKLQHYNLGAWLRERYQKLLSDQFDPTQINVRSTDMDRSLMSAQANLAGMYPPRGKGVWDRDIPWQPVPVHTTPEELDEILSMQKPCHAYSIELKKLKKSIEYKNRLNKYKKLMMYLSLYSGENINDYTGILYIYNTLFIEDLYNFTLPSWTSSLYPDILREAGCYSLSVATGTPLLARLRAGPLLKEITSNMLNVSRLHGIKTKLLKVSVYSAHDTTVANLLNALGLFDVHCPEYTATVFIELLRDDSASSESEFNIRVSYRNTSEIVEPKVLTIPSCGEICPLDKFLHIYNNLISVDWDRECESKTGGYYGLMTIITISLSCTSSLILLSLLLHGMAKRFRNNNVYTKPPLN